MMPTCWCAVTQSDETNLVACRIASSLFNVPTRIARIRSADFLGLDASYLAEHFGVNDVISPEQEVTDTLRPIDRTPGSAAGARFADGKVRLVAVRAYHGGPLVGHNCRTSSATCPIWNAAFPRFTGATAALCPRASP